MRTNIKTLTALILVLALLLGFASNALASVTTFGTMYVVNCDECVSLRSTPSTSGERLAKVPYGTRLEDCLSYDGEFAYCCYNGQWGYIKLDYLISKDDEEYKYYFPDYSFDEEYSDDSDNFVYMYDSERALTSDEVTVVADSELTDQYGTYPADHACDGKTTTTWSEGVSGCGFGEGLYFSFDSSQYLTGFTIWNGYQKDTRRFYKNNRPSQITVYAGSEHYTIELEDTMGGQYFEFDEPIYTDFFHVFIDSVYYGDECNDTCISEVEFYVAD